MAPAWPELAVIGRSNVGKSSLINALVGRRALARTSGSPGKTQACNVYARIHSSSGVMGKSPVTGYTRNDLQHWSQLTARVLTAGGVTKDDVVQITFKYGLFTGAFGLHYGAELIGASVIPMSTGNTSKQVTIMQDYKTTALVSTPSYALFLGRSLEKMGVNPKSLSLKLGLFGGEPWSEPMRKDIEGSLCLSATDNYGVSEVMGPGDAAECECKNGLHLYEDLHPGNHRPANPADPSAGRGRGARPHHPE